MCGIVGVVDRTGRNTPDITKVRYMRDLLTYRGPDESGEYIDKGVIFGHRRLSIIDLSSGAQPMSTSDGRYTIVFNGEIYNYRELKDALADKYVFRTRSDTEVLLYHLVEYGAKGLTALNGMFALALWDRETRSIFLARDRFGKKPLYYTYHNHNFIFASEVKAILSYLPKQPPLNRSALAQYFLYEYVPSPQTPYEGIQKLPAGYWLRVTPDRETKRQWWHLQPSPHDFPDQITNPIQQFDTVLSRAVAARMVADVPVGVLLSGGIDSTTIAWYMRQETRDLHSFSVSFSEPSFNESYYAEQASRHLKTIHHNIVFNLETFNRAKDWLTDKLDEPLGDASLLPTWLVSQMAKEHVTVVLDGDGADELLYGYDTFPAYQFSLLYERVPRGLRTAVGRFVKNLPSAYTDFSLDFKLKAFERGMDFPGAIRNQVWIGSFHDGELAELLTSDWQLSLRALYDPVTALEAELGDLKPLERLSIVYLSQYLTDDILVKIDRATMYASLEARTPFLDPSLVSLVLQLPQSRKYTHWRGKQILRRVMQGRIPDSILQRKKKGFGIPIGHWLRGPLRPLLLQTLSEDRVKAVGACDWAGIERLIQEHLSGRVDHRKKLWTLMVFHWWFQRWVL